MSRLLASVAFVLALGGTAVAADLPSRAAPPVYVSPVPTFAWTGFYVGGQVGYEFGTTTDTLIGPPAVGPFQVGQTAAVIGGAHVGYLYELGGAGFGAGSLFGGGLVVGLEGDIEGSNNTSSVTFLGIDQHKSEIEGSVRGRLGVAVDRALFYATGGAAFAQFKDQVTNPGPAIFPSSTSKIGYTIGGGVEYAITPNWSLRGEYRYTDFGHYSNSFGAAGSTIHKVDEQKVELGVSYRFADPIAPVVARY